MLSFTVRMRFHTEDLPRVRETLEQLTAASRTEPGCVTYNAHFIDGDPTCVLLYEQYRDEAAADLHRATPHFKQYAIGGLYQMMRERSVENLSEIA